MAFLFKGSGRCCMTLCPKLWPSDFLRKSAQGYVFLEGDWWVIITMRGIAGWSSQTWFVIARRR